MYRMNLVIIKKTDFISFDNNVIQLKGRRFQHIQNIHNAKKGDFLKVGLLNGKIGSGKVENIEAHSIEMSVSFSKDPPKPIPVILIIALPRPKTLKKVLPCIVAMGVKIIYLINSWRVEKSYWKSPVLSSISLKELCILGLEQAGDTTMPVIEQKSLFKPFVEDEIPDIVKDTLALVPHPPATTTLPRNLRDSTKVSLAIGPEGGFIDYEVNLLEKHGFKAGSLGKRILRVEHVVPAILGRLF